MKIARTMDERLALIKEVSQKFNKKVKRNSKVRRTETPVMDRHLNGENMNHWTDASQYAEKYYGETFRQTTRYDNDWD
tara:strand:+ start:4392 stop:4625 length:234 start_codon:yes stop_codon:yes gene_type:complete